MEKILIDFISHSTLLEATEVGWFLFLFLLLFLSECWKLTESPGDPETWLWLSQSQE